MILNNLDFFGDSKEILFASSKKEELERLVKEYYSSGNFMHKPKFENLEIEEIDFFDFE